MIALDTNVLVRVMTNDDPAQVKRALALMRSDSVRVAKTVILETEWVLRHAYGLDAATVNRALSMLLRTPAVDVEERAVVVQALDWHAAGMDFADALHLASSASADAFATFDRAFARSARSARKAAARPRIISP